MKLTIGMIVKNEEKWLDKCLTGIKPILDNVDSELIITDTGSIDSTVEIARKYTDKVLHFDWINDFSAARNFGLEKAQGEWFMQIDGDEIFESCDEIIKFFLSGEYKKYNSASYIQKNLANDNSSGMEISVPRLTKLHKNTRFVGIVHEVFNTYGSPIKYFKDKVIHYGYYYETEADKQAKYERNRELLLKKLNTDSYDDPYIYVQLADNALTDEESVSYLNEGIKAVKNRNTDTFAALMLSKAYIYYRQENYIGALEVCDEYLSFGCRCPHFNFADAELTAIKASSEFKNKDHVDAYNAFIYFFENYQKADITKITDVNSILLRVSSQENIIPLAIQFMSCSSHIGRSADALKQVSVIPFYRYSSDPESIRKLAFDEIAAMEKSGYNHARSCFENLNDYGKSLFLQRINETVYYSKYKTELDAFLVSEKKLFPKADIISNYVNERNIPEYILNNYIEKYGFNGNADIVMISMMQGYDISNFLIDDNELKNIVKEGYAKYYGFNRAVDNYDIKKISSSSLKNAAKFFVYCILAIENFKSPKPGVFVVLDPSVTAEKFGEIGVRIEYELLDMPQDKAVNASVRFGKAVRLRREKKYKECISELKNVVHIYDPLAKVVAKYSNDVLNEYNSLVNTQNSNASEMQHLASAIKKNIRMCIESGDFEKAQKTLDEYRVIVPSDPDISVIEKEIDFKK